MRRQPRIRRRATSLAAALVAGVLALAACGGGTDAAAPTDGASVDALPAGLEPVPLAEPTTITFSYGSKGETYNAFYLADALGEFAKENLTVDIVNLPPADAVTALAQGRTDVAATALGAALVNAIRGGADIRLVFPAATGNPTDGLYVALDPATGEPKQVRTIGVIIGPGSAYIGPIARYLESVDTSLADVTFENVALVDMPAALDAGAVDAVWTVSPVTAVLDRAGGYERVIGYGEGEYGAAFLFGPNLLTDRPEVGQAFVRAMARTVRDHLSGDYKQDADVVGVLADAVDSTPEDLTAVPSLRFTAELSTGALQAAQERWLEIGGLLEEEVALAPSEYADPSFIERALAGT